MFYFQKNKNILPCLAGKKIQVASPHLLIFFFLFSVFGRCMDLEGREKSIVIYDFSSGKMTKTKIELETAGKLGNGVAVQLIKNGTTTNFYGKDVKRLRSLLLKKVKSSFLGI